MTIDVVHEVPPSLPDDTPLHLSNADSPDTHSVPDDVVAGVCHDVQGQLAFALCFTQFMHRRAIEGAAPDADELASSLARIESAVRRTSALVADLQDVAMADAGRPVPVVRSRCDLVELLQSCAADLRLPGRPSRIEINAPKQIVGLWDASRLQRAIDNLLRNALKYSPASSPVEVRAWIEPLPGHSLAAFSVADRGVGIAADDLPHIFQRFRRGKNVTGRFSGLGLGLWSVQQIVAEHRGTIDVVSSVGHGSTFVVRLPRYQRAVVVRTRRGPFGRSVSVP